MQTDRERITNLERRLKELERLLMAMENMLSRIPDSILLGPENPHPGWIAELRPPKKVLAPQTRN
jgi:hypothetical protein